MPGNTTLGHILFEGIFTSQFNEKQEQVRPVRLSPLIHDAHPLTQDDNRDFDPKPAVDLWMQKANCRLSQGERSRPPSS